MGQYFRVNGDYNIRCREGGIITLDTGVNGDVIVNGNLLVTGVSTSVTSTDLEIVDNIIVLNKGEDSGAEGVSLYYSGIEINRGAAPRAALVWFEGSTTSDPGFATADSGNSGYWMIATGTYNNEYDFNDASKPSFSFGDYGFNDSNLKLRRILTNASTDSGDLTLIGVGTGVVKVGDRGVSGYETFVTDPDDVPNKQYVDDAIENNPTFQIRRSDTRVIIVDGQVSPNTAGTTASAAYYTTQTGYPAPFKNDGLTPESFISVLTDGLLSAQFFANRVQLAGLEITDSFEITTKENISNQNIYIRTQGTGRLETSYAIQLNHAGSAAGNALGAHTVYSLSTVGAGDTGLYISYPAEITRDNEELVSKKRALLFSMLF